MDYIIPKEAAENGLSLSVAFRNSARKAVLPA